jgi:GDP-L-fucose synthase
MKMSPDRRVYVAGHRGLVGSALLRGLTRRGYGKLPTRTHAELDLTDAAAVEAFFQAERPEFVLLAAAKVGGILANDSYPAEFLRENLLIQTNVIEASRRAGVERLLFLGSSCIYPKLCPQPMREEHLLTGPLEATNRPYALAKIAGVEMCWAYNRQYGTKYLAAMPTNLYGPGDSFDPQNSHVLPALLRKADAAARNGDARMTVWGSGTPRRELMHSDDMADACIFLMELEEAVYASLLGLDSEMRDAAPLVNVGVGEDLSIRELAELAARVTGFGGELLFDATKPDGTPRKLMDVSRLRGLGWQPRIGLEEGVRAVYEGVREQLARS